MEKKIVFFGGTFDPPHLGHVKMAETAAEVIKPEKIIIMPSFIPPHKKTYRPASPQDRLAMCSLAFGKIDGAVVRSDETDAEGKSYSYLTLKKLAAEFADYKIYFLMGTDMLSTFHKWKNPEEILSYAEPLLCVRKGEGETAEETVGNFRKRFSSPVTVLPFDGEEISSTEYKLRKMLGLPTEGFVSAEVDKYVAERDIYKSDEICDYLKKHLKEKRLNHTLGVALSALKYAKQIGVDEDKAIIAALLHDLAKYEDPADYPDFTVDEDVPKPVVHQFLGAYIAEKELGVKDEDILNAIRYHTSGRAGMSALEKVILTADKLERGRNFEGVDELRSIAEKDFEKGFYEALYRTSYKYIMKRGEPVFRLTAEALEDFRKGR